MNFAYRYTVSKIYSLQNDEGQKQLDLPMSISLMEREMIEEQLQESQDDHTENK